jgi:hypothetical protein
LLIRFSSPICPTLSRCLGAVKLGRPSPALYMHDVLAGAFEMT